MSRSPCQELSDLQICRNYGTFSCQSFWRHEHHVYPPGSRNRFYQWWDVQACHWTVWPQHPFYQTEHKSAPSLSLTFHAKSRWKLSRNLNIILLLVSFRRAANLPWVSIMNVWGRETSSTIITKQITVSRKKSRLSWFLCTFAEIFSKRKVKVQLVFPDFEWKSFHPARSCDVDTDSIQPLPRVYRETCIQHVGVVITGSCKQGNIT